MTKILNSKIVRVGFVAFSVAILSAITVVVLSQSPTSASASVTCSAKGEVTNAPDGIGIVFTVTTTGLCEEAPLVLTAVSSDEVSQVLATVPLTLNSDGTRIVSVSFAPDKSVASYIVSVGEIFSATLTL